MAGASEKFPNPKLPKDSSQVGAYVCNMVLHVPYGSYVDF